MLTSVHQLLLVLFTVLVQPINTTQGLLYS